MNNKPPYFRIYLLTVWQERSHSPPEAVAEQITWRFRLEDPRTGRQQAFADAATLMAALQTTVVATLEAEEKQQIAKKEVEDEESEE